MMEQRSEIIRRLNSNVNRKQSLLLEQELDGRVIRFRIRKPSTCDFEDSSIPTLQERQAALGLANNTNDQYPMVDLGPESGASSSAIEQQQQGDQQPLRPDEANVRRMHTALTLNEAILKRSKSAKLVIINLPGAPKSSTAEAESNCKYP